jgi:monofunctional biosynthetic peptidoglycan transglycosylase
MRAPISDTVALRMAWLRDVAKPTRVLGKLARVTLWLVLAAHAALFLLVLAACLVLLRVNPPVTALMVYRRVTLHQAVQPVRWVPLRQIPPAVRNMIVRLEDFRFYQHPGVDLGALRDAWLIDVSIGRTAVGGSTITMQLARNLFLTPRKTYFRKYTEILIALEMDLVLPKNRLLELYLNCIEWGKGIYGIGAASLHYYGVAPADLSLDDMRRLATILTNPIRFNVDTFTASRQMSERYAYLVSRFPDPDAQPPAEGAVAPVPDEPGTATPAPGAAAAGPGGGSPAPNLKPDQPAQPAAVPAP